MALSSINLILLNANPLIDFILPTCPGIPDSMWIAAGRFVGYVSKISLSLLSAGFLIRLLFSGISDSSDGRVNVFGYVKLIARTAGLLFFIIKAKNIFFTWEVFMDELCPYAGEILQHGVVDADAGSATSLFTALGKLILGLPKLAFFLFTVEGAVIVVNYFKSIKLIFLCIVGPLAAGLTLFPFFSKSFSTWIRSFITVSFQAFTLEVFSVLNASSLVSDLSSATPLAQMIISICMFFAVLMTPVWTSMFVSSVMTPNLMGGIGQGIRTIASKGLR
jgi:hypothetical protein